MKPKKPKSAAERKKAAAKTTGRTPAPNVTPRKNPEAVTRKSPTPGKTGRAETRKTTARATPKARNRVIGRSTSRNSK